VAMVGFLSVDLLIVAAEGGTPWLWCPFVHKP